MADAGDKVRVRIDVARVKSRMAQGPDGSVTEISDAVVTSFLSFLGFTDVGDGWFETRESWLPLLKEGEILEREDAGP